MKFRMRPVKVQQLKDSYAAYRAAQVAMGQTPTDISVEEPTEVEACQLTDGNPRLPIPPQVFLDWCNTQSLKAKLEKDGSVFVSGLVVYPGQWLVLGSKGPHVLDHDVVRDNFQGV